MASPPVTHLEGGREVGERAVRERPSVEGPPCMPLGLLWEIHAGFPRNSTKAMSVKWEGEEGVSEGEQRKTDSMENHPSKTREVFQSTKFPDGKGGTESWEEDRWRWVKGREKRKKELERVRKLIGEKGREREDKTPQASKDKEESTPKRPRKATLEVKPLSPIPPTPLLSLTTPLTPKEMSELEKLQRQIEDLVGQVHSLKGALQQQQQPAASN